MKEDIKVVLDEEKEREITNWLDLQLRLAIDDRRVQETKWSEWVDQYEEKISDKKEFPWENSSNISVPLTPIAVETIHAREVNTILGVKPYIQCRAKKKDVDENAVKDLETFLDEILRTDIDGYNLISEWLMEKDKMGTGFIKVYWNFDQKKIKTRKGFKKMTIDDVKIEVIPIEDLIFPSTATGVEQSFMIAHRFRRGWNELKTKEAAGIYENVDKIKEFRTRDFDQEKQQVDIQAQKKEAEGIRESSPDEMDNYELFEIYFDWDVDDDGVGERLVFTFEPKSRTVLRKIYFPFHHGRRPFIKNDYMIRTGRLYSKGIIEMSTHLQKATDTVFNQTIDNQTIANIKCFKARKSAKKDIGKVYPGKIFWLNDPTDLTEFQLGEIHNSSFLVHNILRDYHERRTKVTDLTLGRPSEVTKSRATATGTLALLQESGRHFDLILNNSRDAMTELAYQILELYAQYKPNKTVLVTGKDSVQREIKLPKFGDLREEYDFQCTATSLAVNREIEKQANMILIQQLNGVFRQILQLIMLLNTPNVQLPPDVQKYIADMIKSFHKLAEDMVRSFEKSDIQAYIPELPEFMGDLMGGMDEFAGREAGMAGFAEEPGMGGAEEPLPPEVEGIIRGVAGEGQGG